MRKRLDELSGQEPMGSDRIAYDRTDPMVETAAPAQGEADATLQDPSLGGMQGPSDMTQAGANMPMLSQLGGDQGQSTDGLSDAQLAALDVGDGSDLPSDDDQMLQQMELALSSPDTSPEDKAQIQQQLDLAARRRLLGGLGS